MAKTDLHATLELETLAIVRPGDTLVIAVARPLSMDDWEEWKSRLTKVLPGVEFAIVQANALAVYRPAAAHPTEEGTTHG
jgi:hypothetical protein